jgi:hypothetical protein
MEGQLSDLKLETIPAGEQYVLYAFNFSKLCDDMPGRSTMKPYYFATKEMAKEAYVTMQYFIQNWDRGYHGGELGSGLRRCDPKYVGVIHPAAIGSSLFTKINDEELMNPRGHIVKISTLTERSNELNKHLCIVTRNPTGLPKGMYDEHMLAVLRVMGLPPRIKRTTFSLNPFKSDYVETDEATVRKMRLVVRTVVVKGT